MKRFAVAATCAGLLAAGGILSAQAPAPFKLGTFQLQDRTFIGVVVRDTQVIDFAAADSVVGRGRVAVARCAAATAPGTGSVGNAVL